MAKYRKNQNKKMCLNHLNSIYYIFYNTNNNKDVINEKLRNYILSDDFYTDEQIKEAKEVYDRNKAIEDW